MNFDDAGAMDNLNLKLDTILNTLGNKTTDSNFLKRVKETFTKTEKQDSDEQNTFKRLKQKQKRYQSIPIIIDGLTMDGKKDLVKNLKGIFSFPEIKGIKELAKTDLFKDLLLIAAALAAAYTLFNDKLEELKKAFAGLNIAKMLSNTLTKAFTDEKVVNELRALLKSNMKRFIRSVADEKLPVSAEVEAARLAAGKTTSGRADFYERYKGISQSVREESVEALKERIQAEQEWIDFNKTYYNMNESARQKYVNDLRELKALKEKGLNSKQITQLTAEYNTTAREIEVATTTVLTPFQTFGTRINQMLTGLGEFSAAAIKLLPLGLGNAILDLGKFLKKYGGPLGVLVTAIEAGLHLWDAEKAGKLTAQEVTNTLLTLALNCLGIVAGLFATPLIFLRREDLENNIKKIFEADSWTDMLVRIFVLPLDIMGKAIFETLRNLGPGLGLLGAKLVRKFEHWFFGGDDKPGEIEQSLDRFYDDFGKAIEELDYTEILGSMGEKLGELAYDLYNSIFNSDWSKRLLFAILEKIPGIGGILGGIPGLGIKAALGVQPGLKPAKLDDGIVSGGRVVQVNDKDQILAMKSGGPIESALMAVNEKSAKGMRDLSSTVQKLAERLENHLNETKAFYTTELKTINASNALLQQIRDKEQRSSNVVVQNNANSTIFADRGATNLAYRRELLSNNYA